MISAEQQMSAHNNAILPRTHTIMHKSTSHLNAQCTANSHRSELTHFKQPLKDAHPSSPRLRRRAKPRNKTGHAQDDTTEAEGNPHVKQAKFSSVYYHEQHTFASTVHIRTI